MLDQPLRLPCGATLPNRIAKAAMTEGLADTMNRATQRHVRLYERWARGGAGMLLTGNMMVDARHLERPGNVVVEDEFGFEILERYAKAATSAGNHAWAQLNHPGRQVQRVVQAKPVAPSDCDAVKLFGAFAKPRGLTEAEIEDIIQRFVRSAAVIKKAGFTGVQVHSAHGYLGAQFLSPLTNRRTDKWGGSLENRARFLTTVLREVRREVGPEFPISVKLNSADFQRGGFTEEESMNVIEMLNDESLDLLEISGGNYEAMALFGLEHDEASSTGKREAYFIEYARNVRERAKMPLMLTGGLRTKATMEEVLNSGAVDVIGLARPLALDPDLPNKLIAGEADRSEAAPIRILSKSMSGMAEAGFYAENLQRIADGLEPNPNINKLWCALAPLGIDTFAALKWKANRKKSNAARQRARSLQAAQA